MSNRNIDLLKLLAYAISAIAGFYLNDRILTFISLLALCATGYVVLYDSKKYGNY